MSVTTRATAERQPFAFGNYEGEFVSGGPVATADKQLVIALTGVSDVSKPYRGYDYSRSLSENARVDAILLRDLARSWYQCPDGLAEVIAFCRDKALRGGYRGTTVLGLSMGAFGALSLGAELPMAQVVALSPPISVDTRRYGRLVVRSKTWLDANPDLAGAEATITGDPRRYLILFGDDDAIDITNLRHFLQAGWPNLFVCPGGGHNLGMHFKARGTSRMVTALICAGAPPAEIAAAAGAYAAHAHCPALLMLQARRLLHDGAFAEAAECLQLARSALGQHSAALDRLHLLRLGLAAPLGAALEKGRSHAWRSVTLPLPDGGEIQLDSVEASMIGPVALLGPLVRCQLRRPGCGTATLTLQAEAPPQPSAGGSAVLTAAVPEGDGYRQIASSPGQKASLRLPLAFRDGIAEVILRRRCFTSNFDLGTGIGQLPWSTKLRDIRLTA